MPEITLKETKHINGKVFFAGKAIVTDEEAKLLKEFSNTDNLSESAIGNNALPEDFPGFSVLGQVEGMTREQVNTMSDEELLAINGIGKETLKAIRAYK